MGRALLGTGVNLPASAMPALRERARRPGGHTMTTIQSFAEQHRLRVRLDGIGERSIPGRDGSLHDHGGGRLAVYVRGSSPEPLTAGGRKRWAYRPRACIEVGMQLTQDGDDEGVLVFDPSDREQVRVALRMARIPRRRRTAPPTAAQQAAREAFAARSRAPRNAAGSSRTASDASEAACWLRGPP